jgi:hypothetical protein
MDLTLNLGPCPQCCGGNDDWCGGAYYLIRFKSSLTQDWDRASVLIPDTTTVLPPNVLFRWWQPAGSLGSFFPPPPGIDWVAQVYYTNDGNYHYCPSPWQPCEIHNFPQWTFTDVVIAPGGTYPLCEMFQITCPILCFDCARKLT